MASGKKVGRKKRELSTGEKQLIHAFAAKLRTELSRSDQKRLCHTLGICKASLYKYIDPNKPTLPSYGVLKRAHDKVGFEFPLEDFSAPAKPRRHRPPSINAQLALPLFDTLPTNAFKVIDKKTVEHENALELTIQIRLAG